MDQSEKLQFVQLLTKAMAAYSKPLPEKSMLAAWWEHLSPFPLRVVAMALATYCDENGEFAPVPAGIAKRCKLMDGRPTDDEAWAIALTSTNEEDTVVWTEEIAEAFNLCRPVLNTGDEVGARMAFKDAYNRLVTAARVMNKPANWSVSLGWDVRKREAAITKATTAGLLSAPAARALLPNYSTETDERQQGAPEGLRRLKDELAKLVPADVKLAQQREAKLLAEREEADRRKAEISVQVATYQGRRA